jgi:malic enzyme
LAQAKVVTERMILASAMTLAECVTHEEIAVRKIYPSIADIRKISVLIAAAVFKTAHEQVRTQTYTITTTDCVHLVSHQCCCIRELPQRQFLTAI